MQFLFTIIIWTLIDNLLDGIQDREIYYELLSPSLFLTRDFKFWFEHKTKIFGSFYLKEIKISFVYIFFSVFFFIK